MLPSVRRARGQIEKYTFSSDSRIISKEKYLGDSTKNDWVVDGKTAIAGNNLLLTMAPRSFGTVMASSTYVWYGKVSVTMKTSRGNGAVSAFILMSDTKDEIDFEWIGDDLAKTESNYYHQGLIDCKYLPFSLHENSS